MSADNHLNNTDSLFIELQQLISASRQEVAATVNSSMSKLYWQIGKRINDEILQNKRAEYGQQVVVTLS